MDTQHNNNNVNKVVDDVPLDVLRARYLVKGAKRPRNVIYTPQPTTTYTAQNTAPATSASQTTSATVDALQSAQNATYEFVQYRPLLKVVIENVLFITLLLITLLSLLSFAVPTTQIGGEIVYGKTKTIFSFLYFSDDSILKAMKATVEQIELLGEVSDTAILSYVFKLLRLAFLLIPAVAVVIFTIIHVIKGIVFYSRKETSKLAGVVINNVAKNLIIYIFFMFFGSVSGGVQNEEYFMGYTVGIGVSAGSIIALGVLACCAVMAQLVNRKNTQIITDGFSVYIKMICTCIGSLAIGIVLSTMRMYSVFNYFYTALLTGVAGTLVNGLSALQTLIFPLLNGYLLMASIYIYKRTVNGFKRSFKYLFYYKDMDTINDYVVKGEMSDASSFSFLPIALLSILGVASVIILKMPAYGYGWSANIFYHFIIMFVIAGVAKAVCTFISPNKFKTKRF